MLVLIKIAVIPAPGSGNEHEFVADEAVTAASGAAGKVFKYSIVLTVESVVGDLFLALLQLSQFGGSNEAVTVLAWDPANKKLEIALPSGGVTGIIADGQTVTQGTNTCDIATSGIERRCYIALNKDSVDLLQLIVLHDTNTNVAITSVRDEYSEREYLPGEKWINVAPRPGLPCLHLMQVVIATNCISWSLMLTVRSLVQLVLFLSVLLVFLRHLMLRLLLVKPTTMLKF